MTTYYVDAQGGDDVENGLTWATAFQTLAQLSSVMVSGDSGLLSGVFSGEVLTLVDFANITLGTVGGQPSPFLYGGIAVSPRGRSWRGPHKNGISTPG